MTALFELTATHLRQAFHLAPLSILGAVVSAVERARRSLNDWSVLFSIDRDRAEGLKQVFGKPFLGLFGLFEPRLRSDVVEDAFESIEFFRLELPLGEISLHGLLPRPLTKENSLSISAIYKGLSTAAGTANGGRQ